MIIIIINNLPIAVNKRGRPAQAKQKLAEELLKMEAIYPGSVSLSPGSCNLCGGELINKGKCSRGECPSASGGAAAYCRHFDKMRYSIEALGGNVAKTCGQLLGVELEWVEEGKLPPYLALVCGLLKK